MTTPSSPLTPTSLALLETDRYHADECGRFDREPHPPCTCGLAARLVEVEEQSGAITDEAQRNVALDLMGRNSDLAAQLQAADAQLVRLRSLLERMSDTEECRFDHHGYCQTHLFGGPDPGDDAPCLMQIVRAALNSTTEDNKEAVGACYFCKSTFPIDALIAGYDTWDEQRLACLACNERMQPKPEAVARIREEAVAPYVEALRKVAGAWHGQMHSAFEPWDSCTVASCQKVAALLTENKPKSVKPESLAA